MVRISKSKLILAAAVSALPFLIAQPVQAQFKVGQDGRANEANNRIGSGGYNSSTIPEGVFAPNIGNQIVTGNVTGSKAFRGQVQYTDPLEFRGNTSSRASDNFIAGSAGASDYRTGQTLNGPPQVFYGGALAAPPPTGFTRTPGTSVYNYTPAQSTSPFDLRVDPRMLSPLPTDMLIAGPVDAQTRIPTVLSASPLLGVRQLKIGEVPDMQYLNNYSSMRQDTALDRLNIDPQTIRNLQDELKKSSGKAFDETPAQPGAKINGATPTPFDSPDNSAVSSKAIDTSIRDPQLTNEVRAEASQSKRLVSPQDQSSQYAELEKRLNRYYTDRLQTDEDRNREFLKQLRARDAANQANQNQANQKQQQQAPNKTPGAQQPNANTQQPPTAPDYNRIARELVDNQIKKPAPKPDDPKEIVKSLIKPQPVKINSLADGVQAKGFAAMLTKAEDLMKEGKFSSALDQYEAAGRIAPNNPLVWLGQAHAQIGAGYYARAEQSLRRALSGDPVLTMAQFNLRTMFGNGPTEARIDTINKQLKDLSFKQENESGLPLLLAYIAYNTGNEAQVENFLQLSEKCQGKPDEFIQLLRQHWALPDMTGTNK